jgi:hypothetical protein
MIKRFYIFVLLLLGMSIACQKHSIPPQNTPQIDLQFKFQNEPFPYDQKPGSLSKENEVVKATVLSLNFEEVSLDTAFDASVYANNTFLENISKGESGTGKSLIFHGSSSYANVPDDPELDGAHGFIITADVKFNEISSTFQTIMAKSGLIGGYVLGVQSGNFYLYVNDVRENIILKGNARILPDQWMQIRAGFDGEKLFLAVNGEPDNSMAFTGTIPKNNNDLLIGASPAATVGMKDYFFGEMDNIKLETWTDYIDLDVIRVSVYDVSVFKNADSLYSSAKFDDFYSEKNIYWERSRLITWTTLTDLYQSFFPIVSQQNLIIIDGYAEGVITGVEGLNVISVAAIKDEVVTYYGEGIIYIHRDRIDKVELTMYKAK